ncbi:hypothetical protein [Phenylobacterium sp.]|uniref:hypothetical protein n=1 Tax=Phenylobacterium sp. TaxID=1871053 RepID=UPI00301C8A20
MQSYNVSTIRDAETAFANSGWLDRFEGDEAERAAAFIRRHAPDHITADDLDELMGRFAVEVVGWAEGDL